MRLLVLFETHQSKDTFINPTLPILYNAQQNRRKVAKTLQTFDYERNLDSFQYLAMRMAEVVLGLPVR